MTPKRKALIEKGAFAEIIMAEIDHPEGMGYFWSGLGDLDYGGNLYHGWGELVSIEGARSSMEIEIVEVRFILSGVDADLVAGLDDSVKGRSGLVYRALLDKHYRVVERDLDMECELDYQVLKVGRDGKATIALVGHGGLFWLRKRSAARWSPEEARARWPDETGFDEVHLQEDTVDAWRPA